MKRNGIVAARRGNRLEVRDDGGALHSCRLHRRLGAVVVGDCVRLRPLGAEEILIEAVDERRSVVARPGPGGRTRLIAANVDLIAVVVALRPAASPRTIDRHLVGTERLDIPAVLVLNKVDLRAAQRGEHEPDLGAYHRIGYPTFETSTLTGAGLEALAAALGGRTSALLGPSGAGKSSLVRSLVPDADPAVGGLSRRGGQGRHTTTVSTLHALPGGGFVIDSPGMVDFGEWPLPPEGVADGFPELRPYAGKCRFRDCLHVHEPDCAVAAAAEIDPRRLASYREMVAQARR